MIIKKVDWNIVFWWCAIVMSAAFVVNGVLAMIVGNFPITAFAGVVGLWFSRDALKSYKQGKKLLTQLQPGSIIRVSQEDMDAERARLQDMGAMPLQSKFVDIDAATPKEILDQLNYDVEFWTWIKENIQGRISLVRPWVEVGPKRYWVTFENEEDALAYKLRWDGE